MAADDRRALAHRSGRGALVVEAEVDAGVALAGVVLDLVDVVGEIRGLWMSVSCGSCPTI